VSFHGKGLLALFIGLDAGKREKFPAEQRKEGEKKAEKAGISQ